jgi:hypothetical protein
MAACKYGFVEIKTFGSDSEQDNSLFYRGVAQPLWKVLASSLNGSDYHLINKLHRSSF